MKREKIIAAVLAASLALSLTGCDSDNENVIKAAEDYAEALISLDVDDIAGLMEDEDEAAEELARIEEICDADPDLEDAFAAVSESMTYEIDDKSVVSSKKDKEASVDIVFTLADYEAIHEEIEDEDGDLEAYIDALGDPDETVEVKVTVKFVLVKDKWLVKDKNFKNLNKVLGFIDVISEYSWGILKMPTDDEFIYAVCAAFDVYEDDLYQNAGSYSSEITYDDSTFSITMQRYNDPEEAEFFFEDGCTYLLELLEIDINDCEYYYDEEEGGFMLFDSTYSPAADQTLYGGLYYCDDTCIVAMTFDEADYDSIDELLYMLNLPTP